jgi:hypothetical protein
MYWINTIKGNNITYLLNPIPEIIKAENINIDEITKLTKLLVTIDNGSISRGKYTFFITLAF